MSFDLQRFKDPRSRGIHTGDGDGYAKWAAWARKLEAAVEGARSQYAHLSGPLPKEAYGPILALAQEHPEDAVHVLMHHMLRQAAWSHLRLLHDLTGASPVDSTHAGQFYNMIADWLRWYDAVGPRSKKAPD